MALCIKRSVYSVQKTWCSDLMSGILEIPTVQDKSYEYIRKMIVRGELSGGQRIKEKDLVEKLGASRIPIRESLMRLKAEGFVVSEPRRGFTVREYTKKDVIELYQLREVAEGLAARLAAEKATFQQIVKCEKAHHKFQEFVDKQLGSSNIINFSGQVQKLDEKFHRTLFQISGNRKIERIFSSLNDEKICLMLNVPNKAGTDGALESALKRTLMSHNDVLNAVKNHDADVAERNMRKHIRGGLAQLLRHFGKD